MVAPVRIGILGAANIARAFCAGVAGSSSIVVAAVASREAARAESFARETGIARWHGSYEALLADASIEAIYNPLPNALHAQWSIRAVEAGKHVLCEKPLCATGAEAHAMFAAARRAGVHLVEAYPYRAQAQTLRVAELLRAGAIGRVRMVRASFGISIPDPANVRWSAPLAGGSLMDAGSYPVSFVRLALGACATRATGVADWAPSGVDRSFAGTLEFAGGAIAQVSSSLSSGYHRHALVVGEDGTIETTYLNHPPAGGPAVVTLSRGTRGDTTRFESISVAGGNGFRAEAESFAALLRGLLGGWNGATPEESVDIADMLEALLASARAGHPVAPGAA
ncbi:MAG: Gfo/Idh/MocA family protein [Alphaproteobacteria bacterium]